MIDVILTSGGAMSRVTVDAISLWKEIPWLADKFFPSSPSPFLRKGRRGARTKLGIERDFELPLPGREREFEFR